MPAFELLRLITETVALYVTQPDLLMMVGLLLVLVYTQYNRVASLEQRWLGFVQNQPKTQLGRALWQGLIGGMVATLLFVVLGISLTGIGIWYLWIVAIALMFFHPRFLCFSYGGGLLALSSLLTGFPHIDVPALMALIAILHLVEALLIYMSGAEGVTPVFVRRPDGNVVGGYALQKFWPLPFIAVIGALVAPEVIEAAQGVGMPKWWPLFRPAGETTAGMEWAFALLPVVAALGYSDVTLTALPVVKARRTAVSLVGYGIGLLILAFLAQLHLVFAFMAALFSPLAHEWVIHRARLHEVRGAPAFTGQETMVLAVYPGSPAASIGFEPGDVITAINGIPVRTREELALAMEPWALNAVIDVTNGMTGRQRRLTCQQKIPPLGVVLVPEPASPAHMHIGADFKLGQLLRRWKRPKGFWG